MTGYPKDTIVYLIPRLEEGETVYDRVQKPWDSALAFELQDLGIKLIGNRIKIVEWDYTYTNTDMESAYNLGKRQEAFIKEFISR